MHTIIIGAGAAGCFAAIELKRTLPDCRVTVVERSRKALAKVAITGGGRCNLTNTFAKVRSIASVYPRGERLLKRLFKVFGNRETMQWFENEGVKLSIQDDECVFPHSQDAMQIVRTLLYRMKGLGVNLLTEHRVERISPLSEGGYEVLCTGGWSATADCVLVATGGSPQARGLDFLRPLSLDIVQPVPSLYSFQLDAEALTRLMGIVVEDVCVGLAGTKLKAGGTLLITHWGVSGPAILRLSSYAARLLSELNYRHTLRINWLGAMNEQEATEMLQAQALDNPQKQMGSTRPQQFNTRLWHYLIRRSGLSTELRWCDTGKKQLARMVATLTADTYAITNRCRSKDEFVTCGGIALGNLQPNTLECKQHPGLYFAGEVLDVDAVTGGFNLQAAWTMGFVAARAIAQRHNSESSSTQSS